MIAISRCILLGLVLALGSTACTTAERTNSNAAEVEAKSNATSRTDMTPAEDSDAEASKPPTPQPELITLDWVDASNCQAKLPPPPITIGGQNTDEKLAPAVIAEVIVIVTKYAIDQIDTALSADLKKYTTSYAQTIPDAPFYQCTNDGKQKGCLEWNKRQRPDLQSTCFQLTRRYGGQTALEFVGMFDATRPEYIEMVPLALNYYCGAYEKFDRDACLKDGSTIVFPDEINIAISARITAWWQENWGSDTRTIYDGVLTSTTLKKPTAKDVDSDGTDAAAVPGAANQEFCEWKPGAAGTRPHYECLFKLQKTKLPAVRMPYVPVSRFRDRMSGPSLINFSVAVTEAETPPKLEVWFADKLHSNKDKLAEKAADAINKTLVPGQ